MQQKVLHVLEFEKVKDQLVKHASSSLGKEKVRELIPSSNFDEVVTSQDQTDEAAKVIRLKGNVPLGGLVDVRATVKRAKIGGLLSASELNEVAGTLYAGRNMKRFIEKMVEEGIEIYHLPMIAEKIVILHELEKDIATCIDDNGYVLDSASETLKGIRVQLRTTEARVRDKLESMIRSSAATKMLSDAIITIRNDRFVLPVKQEYRSSYGGIVHDQSSSGATLFIEPQVIVDLNNTLQQAKVKEKVEIERILRLLSDKVAENSHDILQNVYCLAEMDFMFTKAKYAKQIKGIKPAVNNDGIINLIKARHPLLPENEVVPNDIELGTDFTTIVITGPNTGGKTVALKTLGLCTLMAQAGLQIPAQDGSETAVFDAVYADIGDEQSIEQSLSTFSSHMVNIVDILDKVNEKSLVLFDELGAGTDPQEGAALAISILDEVYGRGARVVATTHYPELKAYGYNRSGVINASVEFDITTLSPTYKLLIGVPGRSNAFEISKRLGLQEHVINMAKAQMSDERNEVDTMIASLETSKKSAEQERLEAEKIRKEAEQLHKELQQQIIEFNQQRDALYEKAELKAEQKVEEARQEAEKIIHELRRLRKEQHATIKEHELIDARKRLENAVPTFEKSKKVEKKETVKQTFLPGDEVKVISFDQKGHLIDKVSDNEWQVQMGIMKMKVKEKDLLYIKRAKQEVQEKPLATVKGKDYHVSLELDLRGERFENALLRVEKYLDDAVLAGYPRVSIIHGKGTGALRTGVKELLKNHRSVKNTRLGEAGEGGTGVTIVELK
ncbi:endonuclease MutS2 [Metabacillus sediminilitoris]|uniref:Endonuclease MutS2 n=1 Tax=Metabacillus sediminilitoris TaxID=2567941 RepID=A0A4S4C2I0_9BACI|nr:endonuclease MutS2 [Metabacillus sediminilitoris]QGQ47462.1 endonuclease MutS2 [Metabacillus sediminilitoris]THF81896.1 endonuclease MutS2 [Metabacillus sediminilitoris]